MKYGATVVLLGLLALSVGSRARNYAQYNDASPSTQRWIQSLKDDLGIPCCAIADGAVPDVWEMQKAHYRVKIYGQWLVVPDSAVIKGPNRVGHAVVWVDTSEDLMEVRCFLPGPQS